MARTIIQKIIQNYEVIDYPRLVRLNPNVPWKTRGNGALCIQVAKVDKKNQRKIGEINGRNMTCAPMLVSDLDKNEQNHLAGIVKETVEAYARIDDENTNPGYVLFSERPGDDFYWKAVTRIVALEEVHDLLQKYHAIFEGYKNCRGLIGATAAVCWEPQDRTFELIAYRPQQRWGLKRQVDPLSVQEMDAHYPSTFDNYDVRNHHNRIVPNSPCPILYGIRGENPDDLITASAIVKSEPVESWVVFETNQGTDDHLQRKSITQIKPFESVITQGLVVGRPFTIQGGHVLFNIQDSTGTIHCAAYEPTKEFRHTIRELSAGDVVDVYGGVREHPLTINLEKIYINKLTSLMVKVENPVCPRCGKHMKSKGTNQGYKCIKCGTSSQQPNIQQKPRSLSLGLYEVPVCARRHLSKPLKRMKHDRVSTAIGIVNTP